MATTPNTNKEKRIRTGVVKFDSIPQRLNMVLTIGFLTASVNGVKNISDSPHSYVASYFMLGVLALWSVVLFIGDHHIIVPGKTQKIGWDTFFIVIANVPMIAAASLMYHLRTGMMLVTCHFFILLTWNIIACALRYHEWNSENRPPIFFWAAMDFIMTVTYYYFYHHVYNEYGKIHPYPILQFDHNCDICYEFVPPALFLFLMALDVLLNNTFSKENLIGKEMHFDDKTNQWVAM